MKFALFTSLSLNGLFSIQQPLDLEQSRQKADIINHHESILHS
jgi:hypothetical protein